MPKYPHKEKITFALSMRLHRKEYTNGNTEMYNVLAQDWYTFLEKAFPESTCLALPNNQSMSKNILSQNHMDILILTGGDDWGVFPERDEMEFVLLDFAIKYDIPVFGVCRGMQVINKYFGGKTEKLSSTHENHIATRHKITFVQDVVPTSCFINDKKSCTESIEVNSFHANGILKSSLADTLLALAYADDSSIEAIKHQEKNIYGVMWHPERELHARIHDINLIKNLIFQINE